MSDDLTLPDFLRRPKSAQPVALRLAYVNGARWRRRRIERPEGETWETAELIEVHLMDEAAPIGSGRRLVWVREGRKWCKLCAVDGTKAKIPMATWARIARRAR